MIHKENNDNQKYNIILGKSRRGDRTFYALYQKEGDGFSINENGSQYVMAQDFAQFTNNEIERLKKTLPENMKKIVDLAKTEIKQYYILIAHHRDKYVLYSKDEKDGYTIASIVLLGKQDVTEIIKDKKFLFSESEIHDLKSKLSENEAKVVDLSKEEIK